MLHDLLVPIPKARCLLWDNRESYAIENRTDAHPSALADTEDFEPMRTSCTYTYMDTRYGIDSDQTICEKYSTCDDEDLKQTLQQHSLSAYCRKPILSHLVLVHFWLLNLIFKI